MIFVVVGGSKGLGLALTNSLAERGHKVCVGSRDVSKIPKHPLVATRRTDAAVYEDVYALSMHAGHEFGAVDGWINCQGVSGGFGDFSAMRPDTMTSVAMTNFVGTVNGSRRALEIFDEHTGTDKARRGHLFNVTGAGFDFKATPGHAAYGATKAGITQLTKSLRAENPRHGVHLLNPGMMTTELLYEGLPADIRDRVDIIAESPDVVAETLVIKILMAMDRGSRGMTMNYMTMRRVLKKLSQGHAC
jgi:chlorophyll(ide) b reductase